MKKIAICSFILVIFSICFQNIQVIGKEEFQFDKDYLYKKQIEKEEDIAYESTPLPSTYELVAKDTTSKLYVEKSSGKIALENSETGYIWYSSPQKQVGDLNETWLNIVNSPFTIEYTEDEDKIINASMLDTNSSFKVVVKNNSINYNLSFLDGDIVFNPTIALENNKLVVNIPANSIKDTEDNMLVAINVLPFMGAVYEDDIKGYVATSYENGVALDYKPAPDYQPNGFEAYYNPDLTYLDRNKIQQISMPLFGLIHGENKNGLAVYSTSAYNDMENIVYPSGYLTNYTTSFFKYQVRYRYEQDLGENKKLIKFSDITTTDMQQTYELLSDDEAGFDGVAVKFRDYLYDEGVLEKGSYEYSTLIRAFGTAQKAAVLGRKIEAITTYEEFETVIEELQQSGVHGQYEYQTYAPGSSEYTYMLKPNAKELGTKEQLDSLKEVIESYGGKLIYDFPIEAVKKNSNEIKDKNLFLQYPSGEIQRRYEYRFLTMYVLENQVDEIIKYCHDNDIESLSISAPSNSTQPSSPETRVNQTQIEKDFTKKLKENGIDVGYYKNNNIYGLEGANSIYLETEQNNPDIFDRTVPMYSIVLSGSMQMFSYPINYQTINKNLLLHFIEYNIYPSFDIGVASIEDYMDSDLEWYSISIYDYFKEKIIETDKYVEGALGKVNGSLITNYEIIQDNVIKISYDNGVNIYINYNVEDVLIDDITVKANDYKVV